MKKVLKIILLLLLYANGKAQNAETLGLVNAEVKTFFTDVRDSKWLNEMKLVATEPYQVPLVLVAEKLASTESLFSKEDITFLKLQVQLTKDLLWNKNLIDSVSFLSIKYINSLFMENKMDGSLGWRTFRTNTGKRKYYQISILYFSKDFSTCIVYIAQRCGMLCGQSGYKIF